MLQQEILQRWIFPEDSKCVNPAAEIHAIDSQLCYYLQNLEELSAHEKGALIPLIAKCNSMKLQNPIIRSAYQPSAVSCHYLINVKDLQVAHTKSEQADQHHILREKILSFSAMKKMTHTCIFHEEKKSWTFH